MGHADNVDVEVLDFLKSKNKNLKISQWFLDPISKFGPDYSNNKKRLLKFKSVLDYNFITTDSNSVDFKIIIHLYSNPADESLKLLIITI